MGGRQGVKERGLDDLEPEVSYLYCYACKRHVPCRFLPTGVWLVDCPECIGECVNCKCELVELCLGGRGTFPDYLSVIRKADST